MDKFIKLSSIERDEVFQEVANRMGVTPIVIEKDFWVCWTLKHLYSIPELANNITFKGGTSLSKAYNIIKRFSEDIDLAIDKKCISNTDFADPMEQSISGNEKARRVKQLQQSASIFAQDKILPLLKKEISELLNKSEWKIIFDENDKYYQTILFYYPTAKASYTSYIKPSIRLEFGARGSDTPHDMKKITPYVADIFPNLFNNLSCLIPTLSLERTFWEKATILHALYHKQQIANRMSRHYYDMYMLIKNGVLENAIKQLDLLYNVVQNKQIYFADNKASYNTAISGSFHLVPNDIMLDDFKRDYRSMNEMFFDQEPSMDEILQGLEQAELIINNHLINGITK
jgi:hypothetical protein